MPGPPCAICGNPLNQPDVNGSHWCINCQMWRSSKLETPHDPVNHPSHYTAHPSGVECIDITEHMNFCIGNAIKYLWRADLKNGLEDLQKAAWYVQREIERRTDP